MSNVELQSPWVRYADATMALFEHDPDVAVIYDGDDNKLKLLVSGDDKADSMAYVMPSQIEFGNVTLTIEVIPANDTELTMADHLRRAFAGNPVLMDVEELNVFPGGPSMTYALFAPAVVQYPCDNAGSPYGVRTTTYEDIAKEVLDVEGIMVTSELLG